VYKDHYRLVFGGTLYGSEIWSCSLNLTPGENSSVFADLAEEKIDYIKDHCRNLINQGSFATNTVLTYVKLNKIGPDGLFKDKTKTTARYLVPGGPGTTGTVAGISQTNIPPQSTLAVSLHTARSRGVGSRGRFYLPAPVIASGVGSDGRVAALNVGSGSVLSAAVSTFLQGLNNDPGLDTADAFDVVVATPGGRSDPEGANVRVNAFSIGRVVDTMRSRRNALREDGQKIAVS
jgi:hypothetical protein